MPKFRFCLWVPIFLYPFFSYPFFCRISVAKKSFEKQFFQNCSLPSVRKCVRPSVQKPVALVSVDFAWPKVMAFKTASIGRFVLAKKGSIQKNCYLLSRHFFLWNSQQTYFLLRRPQSGAKYEAHSRNWLRATKAEGTRVFSSPFFAGFRSWKGGNLKRNPFRGIWEK